MNELDLLYNYGHLNPFNQQSSNLFKVPSKTNIFNKLGISKANIGGIANTGANLASGLMNPSGNSTGVGNVMQSVGSLASNIPGVGGIIGAGVNLLGGVVNAAFGSNINEDFVNQTRQNIEDQSNYISGATTNDQLLSDYFSHKDLALVNKKDVGSEGWFSNKVTDLTKELNRDVVAANSRARFSLGNTAFNIDRTNDMLALKNKAAYGGPIHIKKENRGKFTDYCGGKVTNECIQRGLNSSNPLTRQRANFARNSRGWSHGDGGELNFNWNNLNRDQYGLLTYNGTPLLSIKDRNQYNIENNNIPRNTPFGYFVGDENQKLADLAWSGLEMVPFIGNIMGIGDVANDVYNIYNSDNISSGDIGNLMLDIGGLIPGVSTITKASKLAKASRALRLANKLDDVSDKLKYTSTQGIKEIKNRVRDAKDFSKKSENMAIAAALSRDKQDLFKSAMKAREASKFNQGILEGVDKALNPAYTKYNIYQNVANKADAMNDFFNFTGNVENNIKAEGGLLDTNFSNGVTIIGNGGTHEENPMEGIQMGTDQNGIPNLVEEGEVIWNNYVFSNRLKPTKEMRKQYKYKDTTFANIAKDIQKESQERPNDPISKRGLDAAMFVLQQSQEEIRNNKQKGRNNKFREGGELKPIFPKVELNTPDRIEPFSGYGITFDGNLATQGEKDTYVKNFNKYNRAITDNAGIKDSPYRKAGLVAAGSAVISDLFSKPDYSIADMIQSVPIKPNLVSYTPIGQRLAYKPLDRDYYANKLDSQIAASRSAIRNMSGGNRAAALAALASTDFNALNNLGNMYRQAEEYNRAQEERVANFNRQTDQTNSQMGLQTAMANQSTLDRAQTLRLEQMARVASARDAARKAYDARRSTNLNNFIQGLQNLGREDTYKSWLDVLANSGVLKIDTKGKYTGNIG